MKRTQKEGGITLIALVITIIVLLILAGVSIATLIGPNGILTRAIAAKEETKKAGAKEKVQIEIAGSYDNSGNLNEKMLNENLKNVQGLTSGTPIQSFPATLIVDDYEIVIDKYGNVMVDLAKLGEIVTEKNKKYVDETGTAVIPEGFAVVNNPDTIENGLVISDKPNDDMENTAGGNQFVWIPVKTPEEYVRNISYSETNVSTASYTDKGYLPEGIQPDLSGVTTDEQIGLKNEQAERETVVNAGGFYISRFEAGKEGNNTLVSKKNVNVWNNISQEDAKNEAKMMYHSAYGNGAKSALCSGIQWDMVMGFINGKKDGSNNEQFDVNVPNPTRHTEEPGTVRAGQNYIDEVCNIYDLEGNCVEYVAEKTTYNKEVDPYVRRGGDYADSVRPASHRDGGGGTGKKIYSFRTVLYII